MLVDELCASLDGAPQGLYESGAGQVVENLEACAKGDDDICKVEYVDRKLAGVVGDFGCRKNREVVNESAHSVERVDIEPLLKEGIFGQNGTKTQCSVRDPLRDSFQNHG